MPIRASPTRGRSGRIRGEDALVLRAPDSGASFESDPVRDAATGPLLASIQRTGDAPGSWEVSRRAVSRPTRRGPSGRELPRARLDGERRPRGRQDARIDATWPVPNKVSYFAASRTAAAGHGWQTRRRQSRLSWHPPDRPELGSVKADRPLRSTRAISPGPRGTAISGQTTSSGAACFAFTPRAASSGASTAWGESGRRRRRRRRRLGRGLGRAAGRPAGHRRVGRPAPVRLPVTYSSSVWTVAAEPAPSGPRRHRTERCGGSIPRRTRQRASTRLQPGGRHDADEGFG